MFVNLHAMPASPHHPDNRENSALRKLGWGCLPPMLLGLVLPLVFFTAESLIRLVFGLEWSLEMVLTRAWVITLAYCILVVPVVGLLSIIMALWVPSRNPDTYRDAMALVTTLLILFWFCLWLWSFTYWQNRFWY